MRKNCQSALPRDYSLMMDGSLTGMVRCGSWGERA